MPHLYPSFLLSYTMKTKIIIGTAALSLTMACNHTNTAPKTGTPAESHELYLTIGTYNINAHSDTAIWIYGFDTANGTFRKISGFAGIDNPSYLAWAHNAERLYAVSENGATGSRLNALSFNPASATLTLLNSEPTAGADPCYVSVSPDDRFAVTADYSGGSVSVFPILSDGKLGARKREFKYTGKGFNATRQESPHLHTVRFTPDNKYLLATDLGLDRIYQFRITPNDSLLLEPDTARTILLPAGSGPRHLAFHPTDSFVYVINELSGNVTLLKPENGKMVIRQQILADTLNAAGSADIHISPDGRFLYASNRLKGDGIAIFAIRPDGQLVKAGYQPTGRHPRNFIISPDGKYLLAACRDDNTVQLFAIDPKTGLLSLLPQSIRIPAPVCLLLSPMGE